MRTAARLHDHQARCTISEPALELRAREAVLLNDAPAAIGAYDA
jgi:hypothetical protein